MLDPVRCDDAQTTSFQKGQVVVLQGHVARASLNGQQGVLLQRDPATGRYRAKLSAEPWKVVKVTRSGIRPLDPAKGGGGPQEAGYAKDVPASFKPPLAKCDYCVGAYKKVQQQDLPPHLNKAVKSNWPPSPVKRGQMQLERPLPHIRQGDLYQDLHKIAHPDPEDRQQVHRRRKFLHGGFKDADLQHIVGLPVRQPPVQRGRPHRLLPHVDSEDLRALVEEDLQNEFDRKMDQALLGCSGSFVPKQEPSYVLDHRREEEMAERLERIQQRVEKARKEREAAKAAFESLEKESRVPRYDEEHDSNAARRAAERHRIGTQEESEDQRISREFKEYEMESLTHAPSTPNKTPRAGITGFLVDDDEAFEQDSRDANELPHAETESVGDQLSEVPLCPAGHRLQAFETEKDGWSCDKCNEIFPEGCLLHGCRQCGYDACSKCVDIQKFEAEVAEYAGVTPSDDLPFLAAESEEQPPAL